MTINQEEVIHIAKLARIDFSKAEEEKLTGEITEIISYVETLDEAPTEGDESISQISGLENVMREDEIKAGLSIDKILQNAPERKDNFIKTKKVFE